ncbi:hypothetical protein SI859A1_02853 [Aurantimonas manganoxydans SI85-9A1]|uniref:Uncharacterized protein n=1 Tax=Aurantimonas manganoxydans (strain ATCC BAA-1229 / DSM 21871 / SI85-9A1) TaxID=287752 RepID=Q1YGH3_AURMS|nr:hypothetical protein SI859A1_02853 [Aurantimonas manganoxydans SI85-9A1]
MPGIAAVTLRRSQQSGGPADGNGSADGAGRGEAAIDAGRERSGGLLALPAATAWRLPCRQTRRDRRTGKADGARRPLTFESGDLFGRKAEACRGIVVGEPHMVQPRTKFVGGHPSYLRLGHFYLTHEDRPESIPLSPFL